MTAAEYLKSLDTWGTPTEEQALERLIRSHLELRRARVDYNSKINKLSRFKRFVFNHFLGLTHV